MMKSERGVLESLTTPEKIQRFLDALPYNTDPVCRPPLEVLRVRKAHCLDGALFGAFALQRLGYPALLMDLRAVNDDDHVIALYRKGGLWGAVAKSNTTLLRGRDPVYRTLRELAMSYFFAYFNIHGEMSLREYSLPFRLDRYPGWERSQELMGAIEDHLDRNRHFFLVSERLAKSLPKAPGSLMDACFLGADEKGLFNPGRTR